MTRRVERQSWLAGATLALVVGSGPGLVDARAQLVMEQTFVMETETCVGVSCRKQIIGANETFGVGADGACTKGNHYGYPLEAPMLTLFELAYACRKDGPDGDEIMSMEDCGIESVCLDASTDPSLSAVTYQMAFEFMPGFLTHNVNVDVKFFFNYRDVNEALYFLKSGAPATCELEETCHRTCEADERLFETRLVDNVGDGWNAGGINMFDHFRLDNRDALDPTYPDDANAIDSISTALTAGRQSSYTNTMLGGHVRHIPLCLVDGEYLFTTEFNAAAMASTDSGGLSSLATNHAGTLDSGDRSWSESSWTFCGQSGMLSEFAYFRVVNGACTVIQDWDHTPQPSVTPVVGYTPPPTTTPGAGGGEEGGATDDEDNINTGGKDDNTDESSRNSTNGDNSLADWEKLAIGFGALGLAGLAAFAGTYAQKKGLFTAAGAGAGAAGAAGQGGGAQPPNPDVDEFAP